MKNRVTGLGGFFFKTQNPDAIICAGVNLYQSDDGGQTLTSISTNMLADNHYVRKNNNDENTCYICQGNWIWHESSRFNQGIITNGFGDA